MNTSPKDVIPELELFAYDSEGAMVFFEREDGFEVFKSIQAAMTFIMQGCR